MVHAPTPTDDPLDLPALLIASFPLDSGRRHVASGSAAEALLASAADTYASLVQQLAEADASAVSLVPGPVASGSLDAVLRRSISERLSVTPFVPVVGGEAARPIDVQLIGDASPALLGRLSEVFGQLASSTWSAGQHARVLTLLGAQELTPSDVIDSRPVSPRCSGRGASGLSW